jgi:O-antigen/teichoic acid export membrane protein
MTDIAPLIPTLAHILSCAKSEAVAVYSACLALSLAPAPLFRGAGAYILPRMSHGYKDGSNKNLMRLLGKSILLLCPIYLLWLIIGISFSDELMSLV